MSRPRCNARLRVRRERDRLAALKAAFTGPRASIEQVFECLYGERVYQEELGSDRRRASRPYTLTQGEILGLMAVCLRRAQDAWYAQPGEAVPEVTVEMRKIAALAVQVMQKYGVVHRHPFTVGDDAPLDEGELMGTSDVGA